MHQVVTLPRPFLPSWTFSSSLFSALQIKKKTVREPTFPAASSVNSLCVGSLPKACIPEAGTGLPGQPSPCESLMGR